MVKDRIIYAHLPSLEVVKDRKCRADASLSKFIVKCVLVKL